MDNQNQRFLKKENIIVFFAIFGLIFSNPVQVFANQGGSIPCLLTLSTSVDASIISEKISVFPEKIRALEGIKLEGSLVSSIIENLVKGFVSNSYCMWACRGLLVSLTASQINFLKSHLPEIGIETLESEAEPVVGSIESSRNDPPVVPWNLTLSGSYLLKQLKNLTGKNVLIGVLGPDFSFNHPSLEGRISMVKRFGPPPSVNDSPKAIEDLCLLHPLGVLAGVHPKMEMGVANELSIALALVPKGKISTPLLLAALQWLMEPEKGQKPSAVLICVDFRSVPPEAVRTILRSCRTAGILPIIPAGNISEKIGGMAAFPECLTVGAIDQWKKRALFSGQGPGTVDQTVILKPDLAEPGVSILGPSYSSEGYRFGSGTLQAAAHFAGIWAQLRQARPDDDVDSVLYALATTTEDLDDPGPDFKTGIGLVNPSAALNFLENPPVPPASPTRLHP
ncbi:S8 family serine peptidase [bacterium]|nr:S8 family serine peptidase [bacterium]